MKVESTLTQKGNKIILKQKIEDQELNSKDIINILEENNKKLDQINNQFNKLEEQKQQLKKDQEHLIENVKKVKKFSEWAWEIQESKAKAIIEKYQEEIAQKIDEEYKLDLALSPEANILQKFRIFQNKLGTLPEVRDELSNSVMQKAIFLEPIISNPWLKKD